MYTHIIDLKVANSKTHKSPATAYACDMKDALKKVGLSVSSLIGPGRKFKSSRELARRASTLGLVSNADSFAKNVDRARSGEHDSQIGTLENIARAAGVTVEAIVAGVSFDDPHVNAAITGAERPLHSESSESLNAKVVTGTHKISDEMQSLIDQMVQVDAEGGSPRDMLLATVGAMLMAGLNRSKK
jgi:hypothetical protein